MSDLHTAPLFRAALLLPLAAVLAFSACSKNSATAPGIDSGIVVRRAGPVGVAINDPSNPTPWKWAVNTIDSVEFVDPIDSTLFEVTSFRVTDPRGNTMPGTVRFVADSVYVFYTQPFPSAAYDFVIKTPPPDPKLRKLYFIPDRPYSGRTEYTARLTTGIRMERGTLRRDQFEFRFTTGDSVAPPGGVAPAARR